jgi:hypothetical protein
MKNSSEVNANRNLLQKDLRSPKYRERIVLSKKLYNRKKQQKKDLSSAINDVWRIFLYS